MPSPNRVSSIGRMIAVCVLPCLSFYSFRIILYNLFTSGPGESFLERCHPGNTLFENAARRYTGNEALDWQMCFLVTFMRDALDGHRAPFMGEFYAALGPAVILPAIEMRRSGYRTSTTLVCMLILGALYQNLSGAVTLPLWWTLHFLFSGSQTVPLRPHDVEATFLGYLLGYLIISVATTIYQTVSFVAVWQVFPACIVLVQALYLYYHQHSTVEETPGCPYEVLQLIHVTNFCWSTISHAYTLFQALISPAPLDSLKHSFYPTFSPASLALSSSISQGVLKWDILLIVASTLFAGIWLLPGARPKLLAIGWFCAGSLCFGMGAGISGIWMWREKVLEEDRRASVVPLKEE